MVTIGRIPHGGGVLSAGVLYPGTSGHHHSQVWATYSPTNTKVLCVSPLVDQEVIGSSLSLNYMQ